ncbi:DUF262 domain-containing protein [Limnothrix sp. FACHB-708]|uniref:GmrSD restriction endonuclease domain-containing protein n=1 Tax=unclassified Limnothrix TaxID=2632864 RepID=UPI001685EF6F|nr:MULTISPECIES: DUF262 domain-containing protein [unclassified Limnothrix]MBD2554215.1 DUF262 domain-containing protein [Limnothrix sp. FACHB-708]MBD2591097.1 DUF262 domain-containing protein [Limnothrix sp. FACHB-406]
MEANLVPSETASDDQVLEETSEAKSASSNGNSEADIEGDVDDGVPPTYYPITSYGADYPIDGLVKRLNRGDIIIPKFQRSYIWKIDQASRLIESFLLGLPVPGVFLAQENGTNKLIVIDGQQRLKSLQYFYNGQFPENPGSDRHIPFMLSGKISPHFLSKTYETLSAVDRRKLDDSIISATIVRQEGSMYESNEQASIYQIFERLNAGGSQLSSQEVRAAAYQGKLNELLSDLNGYEQWQKIFQGKKSAAIPDLSKRMKDQELILRFLALYFDLQNYKESMKDFLNSFMETHRSLDKGYTDFQMKVIFTRTVSLVYSSIGEKAFRPRHALHAAVFDAVMVALAKQLDKHPIQNLAALREAYENLLSSEEFQRVSIDSKQTTSSENVRKRIELANLAFENIP